MLRYGMLRSAVLLRRPPSPVANTVRVRDSYYVSSTVRDIKGQRVSGLREFTTRGFTTRGLRNVMLAMYQDMLVPRVLGRGTH